jgi:hypothetical protein
MAIDDSRDTPPRAVLPGMAALTRSEPVRRAERLVAAGKVDEAVTVLEAETASGTGAKDPFALLVLGHARARLGRDLEAIAAYDQALALDPRVADARLRDDAAAMLGRKDRAVPLAALALLARAGDPGHAAIVDAASHGKTAAIRRRARELAEKLGIERQVDWVQSYSLDLQQGSSCKERKEAIPRLRALRDKRAIPALEKARGRKGGFLDLQAVNGCLDPDAAEAIQFLQALP